MRADWFASLDATPPVDQRMITVGELTDSWPEFGAVFSSADGLLGGRR
jgi:hypothetical protein